ncbi:MAG: 4-hydroxy-tetrahydrodipicolinate synthase [Kiritimatiellae bacterium]|nr:4-hydroxy-tetrahydrodipicolinate synthase [Kiritimatiellia bacterium]MDD4342252.1 4-hydroxy-tetrahydrodipicolinate synthase [Kiritimatiellia bacterium]
MFTGAYTALVTPFRPDGALDTDRLRDLVERQIAAGIDGVVPVGTTGESPTLNTREHIEVIRIVIDVAAGRVPVIAGTGGNSTAEAIELTQAALDLGATGTLQVTPYYNKPTPAGLVRHFSAIADLGLPVVLYNVPGRSSCEIAIPTIVELAQHPHVVAVKEAGGSVDRVSRIKDACNIDVLCGDDSLTLPMMAVGAGGVISVASNIAPQAVADLVHAAAAGRWSEALALHRRYYPLFSRLFLETNPIPIKAAMDMAGLGPAIYRLPLCEMSAANRALLRDTLQQLELLT